MVSIRRFEIGEEETLWELCRDTTELVNGQDYGAEWTEKLLSRPFDPKKWAERIQAKNPFVAVRDCKILGFTELTTDGRISAFYTQYQKQRQWIGKSLYRAIEAEAARLELKTIWVEASKNAKVFFESMGFELVEENENVIGAARFTNFIMRKHVVA
jgi:putative acetyltransferase